MDESYLVDTCVYKKYSQVAVDEYNIPIHEPVTEILNCIKQEKWEHSREDDRIVYSRKTEYIVKNKDIASKDTIDGRVVVYAKIHNNFSGEYLFTEVGVE